LALAGHTLPYNGGDNVIKGKVGEGGDGLSRTALVSAGTTSQSNGGNNEVKGKVRGGERVLEDKVGGEEGNSKIDESCKCNNKENINSLYSIHQFLISDTGTIGINLAKLPQTRKCLIKTVHADFRIAD
jgi:hypothetical protein